MFLIDQKEGCSFEFSKLISMMEYTRYTTIEEVKDLSVEELDFLYDENANSIGMLLAHIAAGEKAYQLVTFENRKLTDEVIQSLNPGLLLGKQGQEQIRENSIDYYLKELSDVRSRTIEMFKTLPDEWLFEQTPFVQGKPANNLFKWFHVFEDELNHRGQIRLIKKMVRRK
ncbi:DinB family protein [Bacillus sp. Bva_UNVM-123]|uniref:DinB family protein n=1 Tax=Bacillus sp. Bva_UNVM-123 TaxID=2829798 RepID=UPI00391FAEC2